VGDNLERYSNTCCHTDKTQGLTLSERVSPKTYDMVSLIQDNQIVKSIVT
jgi:hypothetical protein